MKDEIKQQTIPLQEYCIKPMPKKIKRQKKKKKNDPCKKFRTLAKNFDPCKNIFDPCKNCKNVKIMTHVKCCLTSEIF